MKLDSGILHLMRLASKEAGEDGWAKVSPQVWPAVRRIPGDLVSLREDGSGFYMRLTEGGVAVAKYVAL